uniref:Myb-like protein AA n=1 Tax=Tanacetum cinerariifolium TaxID=118510 RepID=A0A6L2P2Y2_TANCI|nr:myb-like protein AA [Tanacetum cinerariifolium]
MVNDEVKILTEKAMVNGEVKISTEKAMVNGEGNDQDKLLMASSNNKSNGKWRGKDLNRESNKGMKWKNDSNARKTNTNQGSMDKSKITCYECGELGHFMKKFKDAKTNVNDDIGRIGRISYYANLLRVMARETGNPYMSNSQDDPNTSYCLEEQIRCLDCRDQYVVLYGRVDNLVTITLLSKVVDLTLGNNKWKNTKNLNTKINKLNEELSDCENDLYHYKIGLSQVEARLVEFKTQEIKFSEKFRGLKRDVEVRNNKIEYLTNELEEAKKEKECLDNKLTGFENVSKDLKNLLGSQRLDKNKEGLGYSAVPPPHAQVYSPPKKDLSWTGLPEFVDDTVTDYSRPTPSIDTSNSVTSDLQSKILLFLSLKNHQVASFNTARPKPVINVVRTNRVNDVKASACWVWKPIKPNSASITLKRYDYVDVRGRSRSVMALVPKKWQNALAVGSSLTGSGNSLEHFIALIVAKYTSSGNSITGSNSCRLRWLNHLDPNVKRTDFTIEENDVLIRTHEIYGNRWTRIAEYLPGRSDTMIKNQWQVLTSLRSKNVSAGVSSSSAYNRHVSVDSANNSSGSTITLFGKSIVINEDKSLPCMNKPPSPSRITSAYHGECIARTSTVVAPPAQPKFINFLGVGDQ